MDHRFHVGAPALPLTLRLGDTDGELLLHDNLDGTYTLRHKTGAYAYTDLATLVSELNVLDLSTAKVRFTPEGGLAVLLTNKTGGASAVGQVVSAHTSVAGAFALCGADSYDPIGFVYEAGVADGSDCWVVVSGLGYALMDAGDTAALGDWVRASAATAGRVTASAVPSPPTDAIHFREVGHALSTGAAGGLVLVAIHFL